MSPLLHDLNPAQREAVTHTEGPLLLLAGAGSGKTKTLTHRVAYLLREKNIRPENILAVTFTNKAAQEMRERVICLLGLPLKRTFSSSWGAGGLPTVGTFHSICVRILRNEIHFLNRLPMFVIVDATDQKTLMRSVMKEMGLDPNQFKPQSFLAAISQAKNHFLDAHAFAQTAQGYFEEITAKVFSVYEKKMKELNSVDFDDLLVLTVEVFQKNPTVLRRYQELFRYILVDEYQDTNRVQYALITLLAGSHRNLCVVGDDWQSIYKFRGADIRNILDFEKDYPEAKIVRLEQNYRSTQNILDAAYSVISHNIDRKDKVLWTQRGAGNRLISYEATDESEEAEFVAKEAISISTERKSWSDMAVLYRTNAQSRALEEVFLRLDIPYRIIGGVKFYERKEIKDMIAYAGFVRNPRQTLALQRIINEPKRGIGPKTLALWLTNAQKQGKDCMEAGLDAMSGNLGIRGEKSKAVFNFCSLVQSLQNNMRGVPVTQFLETIFHETGYEDVLLTDKSAESQARLENVRELFSVAKRYDGDLVTGIDHFLEDVALASDSDEFDGKENVIHMMTLHSAKGLEFPVVFIVGLEEGILPHSRSYLSQADLEEERRLMYVGITRAKEKVYLLFTRQRMLFGTSQSNPPSRFLEEIPSKLKEERKSEEDVDEVFSYRRSRMKRYNLNPRDTRSASVSRDSVIQTFHDGQKVRHTEFGEGMVLAHTQETVTVLFQEKGLKKLSTEFARLTKI